MNKLEETINQIQQLTEKLKQELHQSEVQNPVEDVYYDDTAMWVGDEDKDKAPIRIQFEEQWRAVTEHGFGGWVVKKDEHSTISGYEFALSKKQAEAIAESLNNLEE
jgi:hypothetical protein